MLFLSIGRAESLAYDECRRVCYSVEFQYSCSCMPPLLDREFQQFDDEYCCAEPSISDESRVPYSHWAACEGAVVEQLVVVRVFLHG